MTKLDDIKKRAEITTKRKIYPAVKLPDGRNVSEVIPLTQLHKRFVSLFFLGLSVAEISERLGVSYNVTSHAIKKIRAEMAETGRNKILSQIRTELLQVIQSHKLVTGEYAGRLVDSLQQRDTVQAQALLIPERAKARRRRASERIGALNKQIDEASKILTDSNEKFIRTITRIR